MEILKRGLVSILFFALIGINLESKAQTQVQLEAAFSESYTAESSGEYSQGIIAIKKYYNANSYEINIRLAWLNYLAGQYTESVGYYSKCISLMPLSIEPLLGLTYPAAAMGNWEQVINSYERVLKLDKNNYTANLKLGQIYLSRMEYAKAEPFFKLLVNQYPFTYDVLLSTAWNNYYLGKFREAKVLFNKVLLLNPGDSSASDGLKNIQ